MVDAIDFQPYLKSICDCDYYTRWWSQSVLTNMERQQLEPFDFNLHVKEVKHQPKEKTNFENSPPLPVIEALHQYVARKKHILLVGQPGSGKTKALFRYLLEMAKQARDNPLAKIPILVRLKDYTIPSDSRYSGIIYLIRKELLFLESEEIEHYLFSEQKFLLLIDGLNESTSLELRKDLHQFWDSCRKRQVPVIFTTRILGYQHLEIETQLEIQPILPKERQRFLKERVSPAKQQQLQEWIDRVRQSDYTPFVMWMLAEVCEQVNSSSQLENFSLGEAFREFVRLYQDRLYEEGRISDEDCEAWTHKLKHLASAMLSDETSENFIILRKRAIEIIGSEALLNNLIRHHLLVERRDGRKIEFCHQLLQEYYAAEHLLQKLPELLEDEHGKWKLQHDYLNYLKWTETIGLMLGLPDLTKQDLIQLIDLALEVDLLLGIRLTKIARLETDLGISQLLDYRVSYKLKINSEITYSSNVFSTLKRQIWSFNREVIDHLDKDRCGFEIANALRALEEGHNHFINVYGIGMDISVFLSAIANPELLPKLSRLLLVETADVKSVIRIISATQIQSQFYNYKIATQTDPPPPVQPFISQEPANITINIEKAYGVAGNVEGDQIIHFPDRLLQQTPLKEQYEDILDTICHTGREIERKPQTYQDMGEEALRNIFLATLNGKYRGCATGETFNKNGKTDILLRNDGRNLFIAECKIWGGAELLRKTLDQLLGYATWRDTQLAMLIFNRNKNFSAVLEQIPDVIRKCPNVAERIPYESYDETGFRFILHHPDDPKRDLLLTILAFDVLQKNGDLPT